MFYLGLKIVLWLSGLAYFAMLGAGELHAGEAKQSPAVEWERTVEAAKKEGTVVVSVPASTELRRGIEKVFKQRFGIEAELNVSRAASVVGKIQQESKSGVPGFDVHMGGGESMITGLLSEGILAPLEPAMMLKEIKNFPNPRLFLPWNVFAGADYDTQLVTIWGAGHRDWIELDEHRGWSPSWVIPRKRLVDVHLLSADTQGNPTLF